MKNIIQQFTSRTALTIPFTIMLCLAGCSSPDEEATSTAQPASSGQKTTSEATTAKAGDKLTLQAGSKSVGKSPAGLAASRKTTVE